MFTWIPSGSRIPSSFSLLRDVLHNVRFLNKKRYLCFFPLHSRARKGENLSSSSGEEKSRFTRLIGFLLAVDMLGALFLVKIHTSTFIQQEWLAFWISEGHRGLAAGPIDHAYP